MQHNRQLDLTIVGLGLYGEVDRIVAGLMPLQQVPVEDFLIADYSTLGHAIDSAYFSCCRAGRKDLMQALQPTRDVNERYYPGTYVFEDWAMTDLLDLSEEDFQDRRHWPEKQWVGSYILATAPLGEAYLLGGSSEYPLNWLLQEISRYAKKVFSTPCYEPFNDHPYPVDN